MRAELVHSGWYGGRFPISFEMLMYGHNLSSFELQYQQCFTALLMQWLCHKSLLSTLQAASLCSFEGLQQEIHYMLKLGNVWLLSLKKENWSDNFKHFKVFLWPENCLSFILDAKWTCKQFWISQDEHGEKINKIIKIDILKEVLIGGRRESSQDFSLFILCLSCGKIILRMKDLQ